MCTYICTCIHVYICMLYGLMHLVLNNVINILSNVVYNPWRDYLHDIVMSSTMNELGISGSLEVQCL